MARMGWRLSVSAVASADRFAHCTAGEPGLALPLADQTVTTILPICSLDSRKRVASWICSNGKVRDTSGSSVPLSRP